MMSEYISVDVEYSDDPDLVRIVTNLRLAPSGAEYYPDRDAGDVGSPLAQTLFSIESLSALDIYDNYLTVRLDPDAEWYAVIDEITEALKDFFL